MEGTVAEEKLQQSYCNGRTLKGGHAEQSQGGAWSRAGRELIRQRVRKKGTTNNQTRSRGSHTGRSKEKKKKIHHQSSDKGHAQDATIQKGLTGGEGRTNQLQAPT